MKMVIVIIDYYHHLHHDYFHSLAPEAPSARVVVVSSTTHLGANKELMEGGARASAIVGQEMPRSILFFLQCGSFVFEENNKRERERVLGFVKKKNLPAVNSHN